VCEQHVWFAGSRKPWFVVNIPKFRKTIQNDGFPLGCDSLDLIVSIESIDMLGQRALADNRAFSTSIR
jgi:hypothetical protein